MQKSVSNNFRRLFELDMDYHVENLSYLLSKTAAQTDFVGNPNNNTAYQLSTKKRTRLFRWVIDMLDKFNHDCPAPLECIYRCGPRCPSSCAIRCKENCKKSRTISFKTRQLTFQIIDMVLTKVIVKDMELQLLATSAFFLAAKMEESFLITLEDVCYIGDDIYSPQEVVAMETEILKILKWNLNQPTPGEIVRKLLVAQELPKDPAFEIFLKQIDDFIEFCILEHEACSLGVIPVALTSLMFTFEKNNMGVLGMELATLACQRFNLKAKDISDCYDIIRAKIIEYCSNSPNSQELSTKANSQEIISETSDEQKAFLESKKAPQKNEMDIEMAQHQQELGTNEHKQISRAKAQLGEDAQNICAFNGTKNNSTSKIQGDSQEYHSLSNETMLLETYKTSDAN